VATPLAAGPTAPTEDEHLTQQHHRVLPLLGQRRQKLQIHPLKPVPQPLFVFVTRRIEFRLAFLLLVGSAGRILLRCALETA
jgi:hypothetical protein